MYLYIVKPLPQPTKLLISYAQNRILICNIKLFFSGELDKILRSLITDSWTILITSMDSSLMFLCNINSVHEWLSIFTILTPALANPVKRTEVRLSLARGHFTTRIGETSVDHLSPRPLLRVRSLWLRNKFCSFGPILGSGPRTRWGFGGFC